MVDSDSSDKQESPIERPSSIDIELQFGKPQNYELELIENVSEPYLAYNCTSEILLAPLVNYLKVIGYPLNNAIVWYISPTAKLNVYCGNDPLPFNISVPLFELKDNRIRIICREAIKNEFGTIVTVGSSISKNKQEEEAIVTNKQSRRTKERKIGYIIEKVSKWRKLYNGQPNNSGEMIKMTLEEAASKVNISKKSLDDYLLQLRFGRKYGFNFQEHKDDKVGVLRAYVKKFKGLQNIPDKIRNGEKLNPETVKKLQEPGTPACKHNRCCFPDFALSFKNTESGD